MKNFNGRAFLLTLLVLLFLLAAGMLPGIELGGTKLRKVDMLSDLRVKQQDADGQNVPIVDMDAIGKMIEADTGADSMPAAMPLPDRPDVLPEKASSLQGKPYILSTDSCREGLTCIEDYSDSIGGLSHFYASLNAIGEMDRPVRIAVFGDSFIEGDIFVSDLRQMLQKQFGGSGIGYVDITSNVAGFRPTVLHTFSGWSSHSAVDSAYARKKLGPTGHYFVAGKKGAWVNLEGTSRYATLCKKGERSYIYYENKNPLMTLSASVNGGPADTILPSVSGHMAQSHIDGDISSVRWTVQNPDSALFFGVSMESRSGVLVDNFTMRGSAGHHILSVPRDRMKTFARLRQYDLIILEYGLNVASDKVTDYSYYTVSLVKIINTLRACFPGTSILVMSVGDRCAKDEYGDYVTMPGVRELVAYQQAAAMKTGVCFWNLYEAMQSVGGMNAFVNSEPAKANKDYTHINFRGGREVARMLYESLMFGKELYDGSGE